MKNYIAVVGSSFGDEAKGMTIAKLASMRPRIERLLNIRQNGGFQAGHTVEFKGMRHVFKGFGAGTFFGADTFLSEDFIFDPYWYLIEKTELKELGFTPKVYMSKKAIFVTPFDVMINQIVEEFRGKDRHGSVGFGIFESVKRSEKIPAYTSFYEFMKECPDKVDRLQFIAKNYMPKRLKELGVTEEFLVAKNIEKEVSEMEIIKHLKTFLTAFDDIEFVEFEEVEQKYDTFLFEGAQGLLLDQNNTDYFPHLTPSNCGIQNILKMTKTNPLDVYYATRPYITRHGAGPMNKEIPKKLLNPEIVDLTNVPHAFQETLRYGILDIDFLLKTIKKDLRHNVNHNISSHLSLSCLDQIPEEGIYIIHKEECERYSAQRLIETLKEYIAIGLTSYSPTISSL